MNAEKVYIGVGTFILGAFFTHIWGKFKNRTMLLKYSVWHNPLGSSVDDSRFGSVKVLYNDKHVKTLYMSTILLCNESCRDLSNIEVNIACDPDSAILISTGKNRSSINELSFTDHYNWLLTENKPESMQYIFHRRDYKLPVINRNDKIDFALLTTNFKGQRPYVTVSCDHSGVKMQFVQGVPQLFGEPQQASALLGVMITFLLCIPIVYLINNKCVAVILAALIGLFATLLGILLRKAWKLILKLLS
jgi:hypothetical protein